MVYVGSKLLDAGGYDNEASLINPSLKITSGEPWLYGEELGYYPSYARIHPHCRGAYLKWLSTDRLAPEANIGYVFLFFYGLERRMFYDSKYTSLSKNESDAIIFEVERLLSIYGENRSFKHYASKFLVMANIITQNPLYLPENIKSVEIIDSAVVQLALSSKVTRHEPLEPHLALLWLSVHPDFGLKTPARRSPKEFQSLFKLRFEQKFKDGLFLKPVKTPVSITYKFATPSLGNTFTYTRPDLPNPFNSKEILKKINAIAEGCAEELTVFSRNSGKKNVTEDSFASLSLLPADLFATSPQGKSIIEYLKGKTNKGLELTPFKDLQNVLGMEKKLQFAKKEAENLAVFLEKLGFGLIPDVRYYGQKPELNGQVVILPQGHGLNYKPSDYFLTAGVFLKLGSIVCQSDGTVSQEEEALLKDFVENSINLTLAEKNSLKAYLLWSLNTPQTARGLSSKLSLLDDSARATVTKILIAVAHADGKIDNNEVKDLQKLYTQLGFDKDKVITDLHAYASSRTIPTPGRLTAAGSSQKTSDQPTEKAGKNRLILNEELIRVSEQETNQVQKILSTLFNEPEPDEVSPPQEKPASQDALFAGLDEAHKNLFLKLKDKTHWERSDLTVYCEQKHLMLDGALEVINEWSFQKANAPLIEDSDPIFFDIDLAEEILNGNNA
jgi:uncharacterized tellurite resistance protein B-like protein